MKNIATLMCLFSFSINAQVKLGLTGGGALTHLKFDSKIEQGGVLPSFYVGAIVGYRFGSVEPELEIFYTVAGDRGQIKISETFDSAPRKYDSNYKIPMVVETVAAKFYVTERFRLRIGGYFGQMVSVKNDYNRPGNIPIVKTDLSDSWKKTDAGLLLGVNVAFSEKLFIEGSYMIGISDLRGYGDTVTNRIVRIGAGYYFL